jgi:hypothetical protein
MDRISVLHSLDLKSTCPLLAGEKSHDLHCRPLEGGVEDDLLVVDHDGVRSQWLEKLARRKSVSRGLPDAV